LRYVAVVDVKEVYNSNVFELEGGADSGGEWDMITELRPGIRMYLGAPRGLLSLRYDFLGQVFMRTPDPTSSMPLVGYGNNLALTYSYLLGYRTELGISSRFTQSTENITQQAPMGSNGTVRPMAPRLAVGARYVSEALSLGLMHLLDQNWSIRPMVEGDVYYPYGGPPPAPPVEEQPPLGPSPILGATFSTQVIRAWSTSSLIMGVQGNILADYLDDPHKTAIGIEAKYHSLFPDYWMTYILSATVAWRWQLNEFLDTLLGGGFAYHRIDRYNEGTMTVVPANSPAPLGEAVLRYRRGRNISASVGYAHGWTRQPELQYASTAETDTVSLYGFYGLQSWTFEAIASFLYLRIQSHDDQGGTDAYKTISTQGVVSYLLRPGFSIEASYQYDSLFDRVIATGMVTGAPSTVDRHTVTLGISLAWPPPPPQEIRLTRRESEYEPMFMLGQGGGAEEQQRQRMMLRSVPTSTTRTPPPWQQGLVRPERQPGPASLLPEREENPPTPERQEDEQDDSGYYSWPR